jgi:glycosyltransferase domain-containing protein
MNNSKGVSVNSYQRQEGNTAECRAAALDQASMLAQLTIVIPTYNRPLHLRRLLKYYSEVGLQTYFLILDSSDELNATNNAALVSSCGDRFQYVLFPSSIPVAAKLAKGAQLVETPYCAFCADDDLIFPDAIPRALTFLAEHPDYVCTDGIYLNFFPHKGEIQFQVEYGSGGIDAQHPGARVFRLFQRYESMFYAIFRTPDLCGIFDAVKDIPSLHYQELFQATAALLKGKSHRLPEFYAARQHCDPAEPTRDKWQTFYWFVDNKTEFLQHYQSYREDLWRFYESYGSTPRMEKNAFGEAMDLAHVNFFSDNCPPAYFFGRLQQHWPDDTFKLKCDLQKVYEELRVDSQASLYMRLHDCLEKLGATAARLAARCAQRSLDKQLGDLNNTVSWRYKVPPDLWWMASVPQFQAAAAELCRYLGPARTEP